MWRIIAFLAGLCVALPALAQEPPARFPFAQDKATGNWVAQFPLAITVKGCNGANGLSTDVNGFFTCQTTGPTVPPLTPGVYNLSTVTVGPSGFITNVTSGTAPDPCGAVAATSVLFSDGTHCAGNAPHFNWNNTAFRLGIVALPGIGVDNGFGLDLTGGNDSRGGAQVIRQSAGGGSMRLGYANGNTQSYILSLSPTEVPNHLSLNYGGGPVSVGTDLETFVAQPAYGSFLTDPGGGNRYGYVFGTSGDFRGGVFYDGGSPPHVELRGFDTGVIERFRISANAATQSFVAGRFKGTLGLTDGTLISCVSGLTTNASGDLACGGAPGFPGGANHSIQYNNAGAFGGLLLTNGQLLIGSTGANPVPASLTAGTGITITPAPGAITIAATAVPTPPGGSNHDIQYNNGGAFGGLTLTNGQFLIGSTGANPVPASLTAGSGITITPAAGAVTIAATAVSTSPGGSNHDIQYNNAGAFGGLTLTSGQMLIGSTGANPVPASLTAGSGITITPAAGAVTIAASGGAAGGNGLWQQVMSPTPTSANTGLSTWVNQGGATIADAATGISISAPQSGSDALRMRCKAVPATPYKFTALFGQSTNSLAGDIAGLAFYDGTNKTSSVHWRSNNGQWEGVNWNSPTSFNGFFGNTGISILISPAWQRIADDGTNVSWSFSGDGVNFITYFSVAKASGFLGASGYNNVCFMVDAVNGQNFGTLLSWVQS